MQREMNKNRAGRGLPKGAVFAMAVAVVLAMVGAAGLFGVEDIIFPETAALTIGFWIAPVCPWRVGAKQGVAMMVIAGVLGYGISAWLPAPLMVKIAVGYACGAALIVVSRSSLYPVFSAVMLPVILGVDTPVYCLSVAVLASVVILPAGAVHGAGAASPDPDDALPVSAQMVRFALLLVFVLALAAFGQHLNRMMFIAPPLIVGAAGVVDNPKPIPLMTLVKILILCAAAAVLGAGCRLVLTETMGIAACLSAAAAFAVLLLLSWRWGLWFPPAGAVTLLAYLMPAARLSAYALWILLGGAALGASAVAVRLFTKKQTDKPLRF
jgi:hypothetical protein